MHQQQAIKHRLINILHSISLVGVLASIMTYLAYIIAGGFFASFVLAAVVLLYIFNPSIAPSIILRMHNAHLLQHQDTPGLYRLLESLTQRAQLAYTPQLCYIPGPGINAFTTGSKHNAIIALSEGLLYELNTKEIAGVLAHELSHLRHNDISVMTFANMTSQTTKLLSLAGQILVFVNLPLIIFSDTSISWIPILLLIFAPIVTDLIQLALSRVREFDADLGSAALLNTPEPLISALYKMEAAGSNYYSRLFLPRRDILIPSILRTHPTLQERIERLDQLRQHQPQGVQSVFDIVPTNGFTSMPTQILSERKPIRYWRYRRY